ncbi:[protein-PII] uridylyltransferase [Thalassotalea fusca]
MSLQFMDTNNVNLSNPKEIKAFLFEYDQWLNAQFFDMSIQDLQAARAQMFDQLLVRLWQSFNLDRPHISLNAVGGYGRGTLHPKSDIDLCILHDKALNEDEKQGISSFLTALWDFSVDIGHAVRSTAENIEAAKSDISIATNLLDIRTMHGNQAHARDIRALIYENNLWTSESFFEFKIDEQNSRHEKAKNTALFLEPNLKNNPGGMRDVQTIVWIARKHYNVADAAALKSLGFLKQDEYTELRESYDFICRIRWALHSVANRAEERLLFEHQLDVAEFMKFGHGNNAQLAVEKMMRQLFRAMTRVRELNQIICNVFLREICEQSSNASVTHIDDGFSICNGMIQANFDEVFYDKTNVIKLFRYIAEYPQITNIAPETIRLIRQTRRGLLGELQDYHGCRIEFLRILKHANGLKLPFSLMHRYGILASYFPQWRAIEGQMQFDMHNAYTVDEHAFKLIQYIDSFKSSDKSKLLASSVFKQNVSKHVIVIAAMCHDLSGKQSNESNEVSAAHAREFATLHQLKQSEIDLIVWLVNQQHLLVSTVQTQDIHDPDVINKIAKTVRTEVKLNALFCFTVADMMATNDLMWNEWQESLLNELYFSLRRALKQGLENVFEQRTVIRENKADAMQLLTDKGFDESKVLTLWTELPSSFFIEHQAEELSDFTDLIISADDTVVSINEDASFGCNNLLVYASDRSMLFVDLFNTLATLKVRVKSAKILKTKNNKVLEVIKFLDQYDEVIRDKYRIEQITKRIQETVANKKQLRKPVRPKFVENFEHNPTIEFLPSAKKGKTLLRINALDDPRFVERICQVFKQNELMIHSAKISSLGESSENVFLISTKDNQAITTNQQTDLQDALVNKIA